MDADKLEGIRNIRLLTTQILQEYKEHYIRTLGGFDHYEAPILPPNRIVFAEASAAIEAPVKAYTIQVPHTDYLLPDDKTIDIIRFLVTELYIKEGWI